MQATVAETEIRRICVVTGSRADYGLLLPVVRALADHPAFHLQVVVTGQHLAPEFGLTVQTVEADGFTVDARVDMLLAGDSEVAVAKSVGLGVIGFADALSRLRPDLLLILGDRFEILAAAQTALFLKIPIAHLCGGDVTLGAFDESIRHAVTKMAALHFVTNHESAARVMQMGENPAHVHTVGSTGIDMILAQPRMSRAELEANLGFIFRRRNLVVTFHPVTLDPQSGLAQAQALLDALADLPDDVGMVMTLPNADTGGRRLIAMLRDFAVGRPQMALHASLGQKRYYSLLAQVDAMVGNSSSGLSEAPSFGIATVNIGDRQEGRLRAASVIDCPAERSAIAEAIGAALAGNFRGTVNPYGDGQAARRIVEILARTADFSALTRKPFFSGIQQ